MHTGNVVEVMVSLFALFKNLFTVVAASLLGSILSNLLLVMGERIAGLDAGGVAQGSVFYSHAQKG
jgi:calcium/proton exchanger cax